MRTVTLSEILTPLVLTAILAASPTALAGDEKPIEKAERLLKSGLYADRIHALEIVERIEDDKGIESLLIDVLRDDKEWGVQIKAAELLGKRGGKDARAVLATESVAGEIQWVRDAADRALGELGELAGEEAGELLLKQAKESRDDAVKARAVAAATPFVTKEHISRRVRYTRDKDAYLGRAAARALGGLVANPETRDSAIKGLKSVLDKRKEHRAFLQYSGAIEGLAAAGTPEARAILIEELMAFPMSILYPNASRCWWTAPRCDIATGRRHSASHSAGVSGRSSTR